MVRLTVFGCIALSAFASAQSFNMDMGSSTHPVPSAAFGGAANQPGVWNSVDESSAPPFVTTLLDLNGQPTSVTVTVTKNHSAGTLAPSVHANPSGLTADQAALFADSLEYVRGVNSTIYVDITGLAPGSYDYYCYVGDSFNEGSFYAQTCGFNWTCMFFDGTFSENSVWRKLCCTATSTSSQLVVGTCGSPISYSAVNALQIVRRAFSCGEASESYCSTELVQGACACPCGNCGLAGRGCENSFATGGGRLTTTGTASVSADSLVLRGEYLPPTSSALFYQGVGTTGAGFGTVYGDGLRCVGGTAIRLGTRFASAGIVAFGAGQGVDPLVSVIGAVPPSGGTRYYQVWYRNAPIYCTPSGVNLTNGFKVIWAP